MKKYLHLQLKRVVKIFPFVLVVTVALLIGLAAVLSGIFTMLAGEEGNKQFKIAVTGDTDSEYIGWGIAAMQTFDETRFSIDFVEMSEADAEKALKKGDISAYVILPEDFVNKAIHGNIDPITYVTSAGMEGITTLFKKEITALVTDMVVYSQKGAYGLGEALYDNGLNKISSKHTDQISIEYADLIFSRNELCYVEELGVSDGLSTPEYYICAITVMLFMLIGLPFTAVYVKKDYSFNRLLLSRGYSSGLQLGCEYVAHLIAMLLQGVAILFVITVAFKFLPESVSDNLSAQVMGNFAVKVIPVVIMLSAFNIMMFEFSSNLVSGLLLHFFAAISLCYITGCMYPIYAFPEIIQKIAAFLPTGISRSYLATCFTFDSSVYNLIGLILYSVVFFGVALLLRYRKTAGIRG